MRIAFVRHGHPRSADGDPGLTSMGRRMVADSAGWLVAQDLAPQHIVTTCTNRTRETAEELALVFPSATISQTEAHPERERDWEIFCGQLKKRVGSCDEDVVVVGHHPTVCFLLRCFGPPPNAVNQRHYAVALILEPAESDIWRISACWTGRPA